MNNTHHHATTRVYTLANAAQELARRKATMPQPDDEPVDIMGVVSDHFPARNKRCLRIVDPSCTSALVTLTMPEEQRISIGDVIRCNRVGLRRTNRLMLSRAHGDASAVGTEAPHFCHPWDNPEAGHDWFCLGHISLTDGSMITASPRELVPVSMQTDKAQLDQLVDWYRTSEAFFARTPELSQVPHRPKSIEELTSCVGSTGEIVVKVEQVVESPNGMTTTASSRKRRRGTTPCVPIAFAIVSEAYSPEGQNDITHRHLATLVDPEMRFAQRLRHAHQLKRPVRICHVQSEKANQLRARNLALSNSEDVLLMITKASRVTILSPEDDALLQARKGAKEGATGGRHHGTSQLLPEGTQNLATVAGTQLEASGAILLGPESLHTAGHIVQVLVSTDANETYRRWKPIVSDRGLSTQRPERKETPVLLGSNWWREVSFSFRILVSTIGLGMVEADADASILQRLCGASGQDEDEPTSRRSGGQPVISESLLDALIRHKVQLHWKLQRRNDDTWTVEHVSLDEICN